MPEKATKPKTMDLSLKIYDKLSLAMGSSGTAYRGGLLALARAFQSLPSFRRGNHVWNSGELPAGLYYNLEAVFAEEDVQPDGKSIVRLVLPDQLFFCEETYFYNEPSTTRMRCITSGSVWHVSPSDYAAVHREYGLGYDLINLLSLKSLGEYRARTAQLLQCTPKVRLEQAVRQYPSLLSALTREELASFLLLSRSSVHRILRKTY
jgi:hypothetical protein